MSQRTLVAVLAIGGLCAAIALVQWQRSQTEMADGGNGKSTAEGSPMSNAGKVERSRTDEPPDSGTGKWSLRNKHESEPHAAPKPLFEGWTDAPALALVLSGEMHGYAEPCGCSLNQLGGLSRRADLFRQIRERGWPVAAFDTGGLVSNPTSKQAKIKLRMAFEALKELKYAGIALGVEEIRTGIDLLQFGEDERPPLLSCNVVLQFGGSDIGVHVPKAVVTAGDLRIGVTAVFGESLKPRVQAAGAGQEVDVQVLDPVASLRKTVAELEAERPDLLVLLSHAGFDETKRLAENFPQLDLIVSAGGPEDPNPRPEYVGKTLLVAPGQKGKSVAVVGFFPGGQGVKLRYEVVSLDGERFRDAPAMHEHMRRYQDALEVQNLIAGEPAIGDPRNDVFAGKNDAEANGFVGAKVCAECHTKAYKVWLTTAHAHATESIKTGRKGQEATYISRIHDPECVACHVTGWDPGRGNPKAYYRYKSGFEGEQQSAHLLGQQCENCHGPGGRHVELERQFRKDKRETEELTRFREFVQIFVDEAGEKLCVKCHDGDNDPHFKTDGDIYDAYWEAIKHLGRD